MITKPDSRAEIAGEAVACADGSQSEKMKIPDFKGLTHYDPRCSGQHYGLLAACRPEQEEDLVRFFRERGAETETFG